MAITFTGGKAEVKEFKLLPAGTHKFTVAECKSDTTKETGEDCLTVSLKHESGVRVFDMLLMRPSTIWKLHQFVAACGGNPESGTFDEESAIGLEVTARISVEVGKGQYVGKDRNRVEAYLVDEGF